MTRPCPESFRWGWNHQKLDGRDQFVLERRPSEQLLVHYTVHTDPAMLADLERRANNNRSGTAVRGLGHAVAGQKATVDLNERIIASLVRRAANNDNHRTSEGPARVTVKLLEAQTGWEAICATCKHTWTEHEHVQVTRDGDWYDGTDTLGRAVRLWNHELSHQESHWLCPLKEQS